MKKNIAIVLCILLVGSLAACGSSDALKGSWGCQDNDYGAVTWTFDGKDECTLKNDFFKGDGTYKIDGSQVNIKLDLWDAEKVYDFTVSGNTLKLTATDALSPNYELTKK